MCADLVPSIPKLGQCGGYLSNPIGPACVPSCAHDSNLSVFLYGVLDVLSLLRCAGSQVFLHFILVGLILTVVSEH